MKFVSLLTSIFVIGIFLMITTGFEDDKTKVEEAKKPEAPEGMVLIPAGEFLMGSNNYKAEERPVHKVYVDAFYMDIHEVTVGEYKKFVAATGYQPLRSVVATYSPTDNHPAVCLSWHDAMAYAKWAGKRLPTEAEWEKAARGGLEGKMYPWGNDVPDGSQCNFSDRNSGKDNADIFVDDGFRWNAPVGSYQPNPYGLHDMAGNVWEWCLDAHDPSFYSKSPYKNPVLGATAVDWFENNLILPSKDAMASTNNIEWIIENSETIASNRVLRGGSRACTAIVVRVSLRNSESAITRYYNDFGVRCVKDVKP